MQHKATQDKTNQDNIVKEWLNEGRESEVTIKAGRRWEVEKAASDRKGKPNEDKKEENVRGSDRQTTLASSSMQNPAPTGADQLPVGQPWSLSMTARKAKATKGR